MKNFTFRTLWMAALLFVSATAFAQDLHFSQFHETPLYRNPALAGIVTGDVRVQSVFRTQWNSVARAYKTGSLNAEYKMPVGFTDDYLTAGMQLFYDKAGTTELTSTQVLPALNYHKSLSTVRNSYLSLGFMAGMVQRRFDRSQMTTNSQYEGRGDGESLAQTQYTYFDGSVGMSFNTNFSDNPNNNLFVGVAYHHFNKPNNSFYASSNIILNPKYVISAGMKLDVNESTFMTIEADHMRQGTFEQTVAGALYGVKIGPDPERPDYVLHGGAFLRWNDAMIPTIKLDYRPFSVAMSYDVNISRLKSSTFGKGGFELSLTYVGFLDRDNSSLNSVRCPRY